MQSAWCLMEEQESTMLCPAADTYIRAAVQQVRSDRCKTPHKCSISIYTSPADHRHTLRTCTNPTSVQARPPSRSDESGPGVSSIVRASANSRPCACIGCSKPCHGNQERREPPTGIMEKEGSLCPRVAKVLAVTVKGRLGVTRDAVVRQEARIERRRHLEVFQARRGNCDKLNTWYVCLRSDRITADWPRRPRADQVGMEYRIWEFKRRHAACTSRLKTSNGQPAAGHAST